MKTSYPHIPSRRGNAPDSAERSAALPRHEARFRGDETASAAMKAPRGFTALELLITIAVIATLIGILTIGLKTVTGNAKNNQTKVTLGNLQSMIAELEANAGTNRQPPVFWDGGAAVTFVAATPYNVWKDGAVSSPATFETLVNPGPVQATEPGRFASDGVKNGQLILSTLGSIPRNRTVLGQFPAESLKSLPVNDPATVAFDETKTPLILDGWGNPIIFVPAAGLDGVIFEAHGPLDLHTITSQGPLEPFPGPGPRPLTPNARPFWASAGPDGDFAKGDDIVFTLGN